MSKTTNKHQVETLINLMQGNASIARGFYKGSKEDLNRFWRSAETELNSVGPPTKSVAEWKKVWADQKKYVRQKAASNNRQKKGTGGGPNIEYKFSATESAIFDLIGMKESVVGVAKSFGLNPVDVVEAGQREEQLLQQEETRSERGEPLEEIEACIIDVSEFNLEPIKLGRPTPVRKEMPKQTSLASDVLAEELNIQREMCNVIKSGMVDQELNMKKLYRTLDSLYVVQKQHFKTMEQIKSFELEEVKRHNLVMENLRLREIETKLEENQLLREIQGLKEQSKYVPNLQKY